MDGLNLPHLPILPLPMTAKQQVVIIPGDEFEQEIDGYVGKDFEKRKVLRREWKMLISVNGDGARYVCGS